MREFFNFIEEVPISIIFLRVFLFVFRIGFNTTGHTVKIVVYISTWICSDWVTSIDHRPWLGMYATLWTNGVSTSIN